MTLQLHRSAHVDTFTRRNLPAEETWPDLLFPFPELQYPERLNCSDRLLDRWVREGHGDRCCVIGAREELTYAELQARANQIARVLLEDLGMVPGNRVLLRSPNSPWAVACWFGIIKAGGVVVATMPLLRRRELATIATTSETHLALCDARFTEELEQARVEGLRIVPFEGEGPHDLTLLAATKATTFQNVDTAADDVAILAFTSGTTGKPKGAMHFHRDLLATCDTFNRKVLAPKETDVFVGTPPLAFTFGLGGAILFPLDVGAATLLLERNEPDGLLDQARRRGVTTMFSAPTFYRTLIPLLEAEPVPTLRAGVSAGETLPAATWEAFQRATGVRLIDGLGSTEMLHIFIASTAEEARPGSTGTAVPGYVAEIQDDEGRTLPTGEVGLLAVKGPTGCRYLRGDRQGRYVQRGWNLTGDLYFQDQDGHFHYVSRADDMIISAGYNIAGPEVEGALLLHPDVEEVAVVGAPDPERGQVVKAFVHLRPGVVGDAAQAEALQDFCKEQIAPYKYPRAVEFVESLPRTETGKLQRFKLRDA
ncbi:MAG: AMP-binding protein [Candidatus Dormibacteraeota bacterium]|nr:AMP-binding protein [Candidatus Dormibacteraeota bacterium]